MKFYWFLLEISVKFIDIVNLNNSPKIIPFDIKGNLYFNESNFLPSIFPTQTLIKIREFTPTVANRNWSCKKRRDKFHSERMNETLKSFKFTQLPEIESNHELLSSIK